MQAQIAPDTTLPNSSIVTPNGNARVITGGTQAETNLFHSFSEFSVPYGGSASFQQIDQRIENVISRVTGSSASNIDGLIEVLQANGTVSSADFFLINPNGIIFGANAKLNIGGSFMASTASSLNFADGTSFSATAHPTTPLLTVSVPIGLQFGSPTASIQVQGATLIVPTGNTLGLVGGDLTLMGMGGGLVAAGGRIELGSVAGPVTPVAPVQISLTPVAEGWALGYEGIQNFQDIQLSQQAIVDASGNGGGDIQVQGRSVTLTGISRMLANTQGTDPGGTLAVSASDSIEISGSSTDGQVRSGLSARVNSGATGAGGNLTLQTRQLEVQDGAEVSTATYGSGKGGNLTVQATESVLVSGNSRIRATVQERATGDGGNLTVETGRLLVQDVGQILTNTFGSGKAGNLTVQNATEVKLVGGVVADGEVTPSGLFTQTAEEATGDGGNLLISAGKLTLQEGAQINSTTYSLGRAGDLTVRATDVELVGAASTNGELFTDQNLPFSSGLFAGTEIGSTGDGGTLTVETERLSLQDGAVVQTSTLGEGAAGNLIIQASESVKLTGTAKGSPFPTSLLAVSGGIPGLPGIIAATGKGGDLTLATGELIVRDGAAVAVSSLNPTSEAKGAGDIDITAQTIRLDNRASITAATASGDGGSIKLQNLDLLLLRDNSNISTEAGTEKAGGNGGNINIDAGFVVALPQENSDLIANAFEGSGGNINIRTQSIFGLSRNDELEPRFNTTSDITASSRFGLAGTVTINTPDVDPSRGLVNLPAELVDASNQIAAGCATNAEAIARNVFIITGRGGLPPSPTETLSGETVLTNWATLDGVENRSDAKDATNATRVTAPAQIVEAQGWAIASDGEVTLTAPAPTTPNTKLNPTSCNRS